MTSSGDAGAATADPPASPTPSGESLARLEGITKRFPGVLALDSVDIDLIAGEVHVLFGENGAGKSTLINILAGTYPPSGGRYHFQGQLVQSLTPYRARRLGISPVFQEFSLIPDLSVEQNLFLGHEPSSFGVLRPAMMRAVTEGTLGELGFDLDPDARILSLSRAHQQMVEIAKALLHDVRLLILDEPTASLTEQESAKLFALIGRLKARNIGILYVSHRLAEIKRLADQITVLRDGRKIKTVAVDAVTETDLVEMMTGRKVEQLFPEIEHRPEETVLETRGLTTVDNAIDDVSVTLRAGEIVGVAGLVGCGKGELARAIFGLEPIATGQVLLDGESVADPSPSTMLARGVCYFPSDRATEGLAVVRPVRENASMAALDLPAFSNHRLLKRRAERGLIDGIMTRLNLRARSIDVTVEQLSGGNRQKVVLARGMTRPIRVFLLDEPTVGIDVGAKTEIYRLIKQLAEDGAAVMLISSELPEVLHLANRLYVLHRGRLVAELTGAAISEEAVLAKFFDRDRRAAS